MFPVDNLTLEEGSTSRSDVLGKRKYRGESTIDPDPKNFDIEEGEISDDVEKDMDIANSPNHEAANVYNASFSKSTPKKNAGAQPFVRVTYSCLARASKKKLEELLRIWSEWYAQTNLSSQDDEDEHESGESTYFPALCVGSQSSVSFVEDKTHFVNTPFYDRDYAYGLSNVEGGGEILGNASRCFNCGSYDHSLKDCDRPRDSVAVNNARKEFKSKRTQTFSSVRYYETSFAGRFHGLTPGRLHPETREALGLRELDPPPWLKRMRELGYPPGYLEVDEDDRPSGITIFGEENDDGEGKLDQPKKRKSVDFPGVNAPIPENADESLWVERQPQRNTVFNRLSRGSTHDDRWRGGYADEGPPGVGTPSSRYGQYSTERKRVRIFSSFDPSPESVVRHFRRGDGDYGARRW